MKGGPLLHEVDAAPRNVSVCTERLWATRRKVMI